MGAVEKSRTHETPKAQVVTAAPLTAFSWLIHGFSTRQGGRSDVYGGRSLNLGFTKQDSHSVVEQNRRTFLRGLGASKNARLWPLVTQQCTDRKSTRLNSSHTVISYAVFCLKKKTKNNTKDKNIS